METGGNYPPVTAEQLAGSKSSHRTGRDEFDFTWSFQLDTFVIEGNDLPQDLVVALLGPEATASRIQGTWEIRSGTIHFAVPTDNSDAEHRKSSLPIYFTGVIRIETSEAQYVF